MAPICVVTPNDILITSVRAPIVNSLTSIGLLASLGAVAYDGAAVFNKSC
jgi:hypothetical protein